MLGVIIFIMFSLIIPSIIVEHKSAFESLGRSGRFVSDRQLKTFALLLIVGTIAAVTSGVALC